MKQKLTILVGAVLILIFLSAFSVFQVRTTEVAVVTTWGKATRPITEPGFKWKWPPPIQKVHKFDKRIYNFESKLEQVLTPDGYNLLIMVYAGWNISQPDVFFPRFNGSIKQAEENLEGLVRNAYSGVVGKHPFTHFISTDEKELRFVEIEQDILRRIKEDAEASHYGIEVQFLGIKKLELPESVTESVFGRMQEERKFKENSIKFEGEREANNIRSAANLAAANLLIDSDSAATSLRGLGEAEAAKAYGVFRSNPQLADFLLKVNGLEVLLQGRTSFILDDGTPDLLRLLPTVPK